MNIQPTIEKLYTNRSKPSEGSKHSKSPTRFKSKSNSKLPKRETSKMVTMKLDLSKKCLGKINPGTDKTIVQGIYDPVEIVSHRTKNSKSSSLLPNYSTHQQSKTIFDWKKHLMKKHDHPNYSDLTLDLMDADQAKRKRGSKKDP